MIPNIEVYFTDGCGRCDRFATPDCSTRHWQAGLLALRQLCLSAGLTETLKWRHPCYMHAGRNIAVMGAFLQDFRLSFFHAALLQDSCALLERQGPNTAHPDMIRFTDPAQVGQHAPATLSCLRAAMDHAQAGRTAPKPTFDLALPAELVDALDADPDLAEAFCRLTPGRQKSHVIALASAKTSATRSARLLRLRDKILSGQGAQGR
ncbi:MAG: YdeI/OmpD-associated family protein [Rhodobacteraceae bacterium]|nr:YdeI/OmpD-associated family protein [Paracoccaceae bacterium]